MGQLTYLKGKTPRDFDVTLALQILSTDAFYTDPGLSPQYGDIRRYGTNLSRTDSDITQTFTLNNGNKLVAYNNPNGTYADYPPKYSGIKCLFANDSNAYSASFPNDPDANYTLLYMGLGIYETTNGDFQACAIAEYYDTVQERYYNAISIMNVPSPQLKQWLGDEENFSDNDDPYYEDDSRPGGGGGNHDNESDDISEPSDPSISVTDSGFVQLYTPTVTQMRMLYNYLWSTSFDLDNFKKMFQNPMEAILGLSALPFSISAGTSQSVKLGNVNTGINMPIVANQYKTIDCGSISIGEYWGSYLDYNPYTEISIYLPYIGVRALDVDEIMGHSINVTYKIDVVSGGCIALIKVDGSVRYSFSGSCSVQMPINRYNFDAVISGAIQIGASLVGGLATGGAGAGFAVASTANAMMNMKTHIEKTGSLGGSSGILGVQKPYAIIKRPNPCVPYNQNEIQGYPAFTYIKLDDLSGFTRVSDIFLENINATDGEKDEILTLLKGGVIL